MRVFGRRYDDGRTVCLEIEGGKIASVSDWQPSPGEAAPAWIAPAMIDLQVNGYGGQEFSAPDLTPEKVAEIAQAMDRFGVTRFCPTVTTAAPSTMEHALRTINAACSQCSQTARRVAAIHLDGPYLSRESGPRGAHPLEHCRPPDTEQFFRFQEAAGGRIRIVTISPEYDGATEFIRRTTASGVVVSIGHTAASPEQIHAAAEAGATMSTHLGNGCHPTVPRHRNYLWAQLADDRLSAGLIVDGHHLPPDVVKSFVRAKSPSRCILVSDLSGMAGLAPGRYATNLCELEILPGGKIVVAGQRELLAGASAPLGEGVANVMHFAGVALSDAVAMAVDHPAAMLGLDRPALTAGAVADLMLFEVTAPQDTGRAAELRIIATLVAGELSHGVLRQAGV